MRPWACGQSAPATRRRQRRRQPKSEPDDDVNKEGDRGEVHSRETGAQVSSNHKAHQTVRREMTGRVGTSPRTLSRRSPHRRPEIPLWTMRDSTSRLASASLEEHHDRLGYVHAALQEARDRPDEDQSHNAEPA